MFGKLFGRSNRPTAHDGSRPEAENTLEAIPTEDIRRAEDGSEMLYGLARQLESANAAKSYVDQVRGAAHAIRKLTNLHPEHDHVAEDGAFGANEHASEIRKYLR